VVVGFSRPPTSRYVLRALASLGVRSIEFVPTDTGERSYASSKLWSTGEYTQIVTLAVSQAFETRLPEVRLDRSLDAALANRQGTRVCLDNYEATASLSEHLVGGGETCLVFGSERGWTTRERGVIRDGALP
jgi:16S rRNA (uracil1498-N3)-methyltransferase